MSAEIVKKRGRPKKVISDTVEVEAERAEIVKPRKTRAKSTTTTIKPVTSKTKAKKAPSDATSTIKKASGSLPSQESPTKPSVQQSSKVAHTTTAKIAKSTTTPVTPETSKILSEIREISAKNVSSLHGSTNPSNSPSTLAPSELQSTTAETSTSPRPLVEPTSLPPVTTISGEPISANQPRPTPSPSKIPQPLVGANPASSKPPKLPPKSAPKIPLAALNSAIVDNISTRAGARPNAGGSKNSLPPNYKPVARKVTMAIVAMPIVIVTSWVLYQRCTLLDYLSKDISIPPPFFDRSRFPWLIYLAVVLGEDRKLLVKPGLTPVETNSVEAGGSRGKESST